MSLRKKPEKSCVLQETLSLNTQMKELSLALEQKEGTEDTIFKRICKNSQHQPQRFVIAECLPKSSLTICNVRWLLCEKPIQKLKSSKISDLDLISKEKGCRPYWNESCQILSSHLWFPTATDLPVLDSQCLNISSKKSVEKSWFKTKFWAPQNMNSQKICLPSSTTSAAECTAKEVTKTRKIRIFPTPTQIQIFKHWLGVARLCYNNTINKLQKEKLKSWMDEANQAIKDLPEWAETVPYQVKRMAIKEAFSCFVACCKRSKATGQAFKMKFKSKKTPRQSIYIPKQALLKSGIFPRLSKSMRYAEDLPEDPMDSRLLLQNERWFVVVPVCEKVQASENQGRVVALDPGIRTFITGYAKDLAFKIGQSDFSRLQRLAHHMDDLVSRMSKTKGQKKSRMKRAKNRMQWKIWNLVDELHWKSIRFLTSNFDTILLPTFETSNMVKKSHRKLRSKTVRNMLTFAHYRFGQRLQFKADSVGKEVVRVNEAYTSKTASWTGEIVPIGAKKHIKSHGTTMDRDINGARGILLRALVESPSLKSLENFSKSLNA
jgi:putative transposase